MRKLILFIATSLDGYIARRDGGIDWLFHDQDYGYSEFMATVDTVVMGRKTWDLGLGFSADPYPGKRAYVFTHQTHPTDARATFVSTEIAAFTRALKAQPGGAIWLVGGGEIVGECHRHALIDEYRIFVHPLILGDGLPLFAAGLPQAGLRLVQAVTFSSGLVELRYLREAVE